MTQIIWDTFKNFSMDNILSFWKKKVIEKSELELHPAISSLKSTPNPLSNKQQLTIPNKNKDPL